MTRELSPDVALFVGNGHEFRGLDRAGNIISYNDSRSIIYADFDADTLKDLWNNSVGIRLGSRDGFDLTHVDAFNYAVDKGHLLLSTQDVVAKFFLDDLRNDVHRGRWFPNFNLLFMTGEDYLVAIDFNTGVIARTDY